MRTSEAEIRTRSTPAHEFLALKTSRRPLVALIVARLKELSREPAVLFWNFVFPILLAAGLGVVRTQMSATIDVLVVDNPSATQTVAVLSRVSGLRTRIADEDTARRFLRTGRAVLVLAVHPRAIEYRFDPDRGEARLARALADEALQDAAGRRKARPTSNVADLGAGGRYVDFLVPGVLALTLMNGGLWGVGFGLVNVRIRQMLKTLAATPMRKRDFLLSLLLSRLAFVALEAATLLGLARWLLGVHVVGSLAVVTVIVLLGALTFSALGMLLAARAETLDTISGLINATALPMVILSGLFFSIDRLPAFMQSIVLWLPLTALIQALRSTMTEGAGMVDNAWPLLVLCGWCGLASAMSLRIFRWT